MAKKPAAAKTAAANAVQPYYLQRAHIKGFRSIRNAAVEFQPGLNIIIGANGAGKTNLIRVIQDAVPNGVIPYNATETTFIFSGEHLVKIKNTLKKNSRQLQGSAPDPPFYPYRWNIEVAIDGIKHQYDASLQHGILRELWQGLNRERMTQKLPILSPPYPALVINHSLPEEYVIAASPNDLSIQHHAMQLFTTDSQFVQSFTSSINASLYFHQLKDDGTEGKKLSREQIEQLLKIVFEFYLDRMRVPLRNYGQIEDIRFVENIRVYTNPSQQEIIIKGVVLEFKVNKNWLPFSSLSSGTQRLFYIISEVLSPVSFFTINKGVKGYSLNDPARIIIIEEPELGIHPDQLHLLLSFLREQSKKHQLIVTTHAPQVLDMLHDDELDRITICELDAQQGTQFRKLTAAQIDAARRYMTEVGFLSDYWRYGSLEEKI